MCFQCSITCGSGIETRYVACMVLDDLEEQMATMSECDVAVKPASERTCNRDPCVQPRDFDVISISSNRVQGSSHWRAGPWGGVSEFTSNSNLVNYLWMISKILRLHLVRIRARRTKRFQFSLCGKTLISVCAFNVKQTLISKKKTPCFTCAVFVDVRGRLEAARRRVSGRGRNERRLRRRLQTTRLRALQQRTLPHLELRQLGTC